MADVSWLGSLLVLCTVASSFVTSNLTIRFDLVSVLFGFCGGSLYSIIVPALVCSPELCILVVFALFLVFMSTRTFCVAVQTGFFAVPEADVPFSICIIQFLKLLQMPTILCFLLSCLSSTLFAMPLYLFSSLINIWQLTCFFGWLCHSWILLKSFPQRNTALLTEFSILVAETRCGL